jgi:hypothetical protein
MSDSHMKMVSALPCLVCGRAEPYVRVDPHHLQRGLPVGERGMSRRAADRYLIPLCREHHTAAEAIDDEAWLTARGIQGRDIAAALWGARGDENAMTRIVERSLLARRIPHD